MERTGGISGFELAVLGLGGAVVGIGGTVWAGAALAALSHGRGWHASLTQALAAAARLRSHLGDPKAAWGAAQAAGLPGPALYWTATAAAALAIGAVIAGLAHLVHRSRVGTLPRSPLGVDSRARFAKRPDLKALVVSGPQPGRFLLGRAGRVTLATEAPAAQPGRLRARRPSGVGDRGAVALIGPSRSGKTSAAVSGILTWDGPAVLSSVKADLLAATCGWRRRLGQVRVYDPTRTTGAESASWSPLASATTTLGAQRAARALCEAAPRGDDVKGGLGYWLAQTEILLSGLLWIAAHAGVDMGRVCEWVLVQDRPSPDAPGEIRTALDSLLASPDPVVSEDAARAAQAVMSIWAMEDETRSSVYGTAQTVVWPWADPGVADASKGESISLPWLVSGANTVYLCAPLDEQARLAPAFGGLLNDLVKQVYLHVAATGRPLDPPLLVVIDEAGNTPLRSLPQYASTLAGLGVLLVTVWQSIAQIEVAYGRQADTVLTNHLSKLFYRGLSDPAAFRYVAAVLGEVEVETRSRTHSGTAPASESRATTREPLVAPHMVREMPAGDALLIHGSLPPIRVRTRPYWEDPALAARARLDPARGMAQPAPATDRRDR
ncbi:MAG TPA: type IV secretory system conjugative DNA transfer family protein [Acidimicrobiales bacterium]|nr:type IV secretory system conjugative DNA transfer family protein [Acidimicrobiales bacterium]